MKEGRKGAGIPAARRERRVRAAVGLRRATRWCSISFPKAGHARLHGAGVRHQGPLGRLRGRRRGGDRHLTRRPGSSCTRFGDKHDLPFIAPVGPGPQGRGEVRRLGGEVDVRAQVLGRPARDVHHRPGREGREGVSEGLAQEARRAGARALDEMRVGCRRAGASVAPPARAPSRRRSFSVFGAPERRSSRRPRARPRSCASCSPGTRTASHVFSSTTSSSSFIRALPLTIT